MTGGRGSGVPGTAPAGGGGRRRTGRVRLPPANRLAALVAVWIVLVGGALLLAQALDSPVGAGEPDEARPAVPEAAATSTAAKPKTAVLPPFAMVLDHPLPSGIAKLPPARQALELRVAAMKTKDPATFVELGSVLQLIGDTESAGFSYRSALKFDAASVPAQVGLAVVDGGAGDPGLARAAFRLAALERAHPGNQMVSFNRAWVAVYRGRAGEARRLLRRTVSLDPTSRLGGTAAALDAALDSIALDAPP